MWSRDCFIQALGKVILKRRVFFPKHKGASLPCKTVFGLFFTPKARLIKRRFESEVVTAPFVRKCDLSSVFFWRTVPIGRSKTKWCRGVCHLSFLSHSWLHLPGDNKKRKENDFAVNSAVLIARSRHHHWTICLCVWTGCTCSYWELSTLYFV